MKIKNKKGFSIIELSVSLTIIGIIILFAMSSLQAIGDNMAATKTEVKIDGVVNSIINNVSSATSASTVESSGVRDLRLPSQSDVASLLYETDGYGNNFDYIPAANLLDTAAGENLCMAQKTDLILKLKEHGASEYISLPQVAFVIMGKGANLLQDYDNSTSKIIKLDRNGKSDDVFRYVTLDELKYKVGCSVGTTDEFKILTEELPPLASNTIDRLFTTRPPSIIDPMSGLPMVFWCLEVPNEESARRSIAYGESWGYNNFQYPVKINKISIMQNNCSDISSGGDGLGAEIRLSRTNNAIPGTYKMRVVANLAKDVKSDKKNFVVMVPFE